MGMKYSNVLRRPFLDFKKFLVALLIFAELTWVVAITRFLRLGYLLKVSNMTLKKHKGLPSWKNVWDLFKKGFFGMIVNFIYFISVLIFYVISYFVFDFRIGNVFSDPIYAPVNYLLNLQGAYVLLGILLIILLFLSRFLSIIGLVEYSRNFKIIDGLHFSEIFKKSFNLKYFFSWLLLDLVPLLIIAFLPFSAYFRLIPIEYLGWVLIVIWVAFRSYVLGVISFTIYPKVLDEKKT